jgi:beta-galactosidase/beta-glucuronidase
LVILPPDYVSRLHAETDFDPTFKNAKLKVTAAVMFHRAKNATLNLHLRDPRGRDTFLDPNSMVLSSGNPEATIEIPISASLKWDAEHPNLYTLGAEVVVDGSVTHRLERKIGFRKVERRKNKLYVNGEEVKLRGVCRHDVHPLRGRSTTPEMDEKDAILLRDANVNFVRTSHYPPTESFLEACDQYGIYVEDESAVCFVDQAWSVSGSSESAPDFAARFMNQFAEMIERDRSHPSVIIWSLGNESRWGTNFKKERVYLQQEDPTRPVIFSFPESVPAGVNAFDIYSDHYPAFNGDLTSQGAPKLNDEYAHVSCYNTETLKRDPGVRNFWGYSLKRFWENCYAAEGCLGGAIWAGFDEVFLLPGSPAGYGEWGIVDGWRRKKPEYWLTKKAYSPVRIADSRIPNPGTGQPLEIHLKNWFNHTHFKELKIIWSVGTDSGEVNVDLAPGAQGTARFPARAWQDGDVLNVKFYRADGVLVDEHDVRVGHRRPPFPAVRGPAPKVFEDTGSITIQGSDFNVIFSKARG